MFTFNANNKLLITSDKCIQNLSSFVFLFLNGPSFSCLLF